MSTPAEVIASIPIVWHDNLPIRFLMDTDDAETILAALDAAGYVIARKCTECEGSGIVDENHGQGMYESLGCHDCMGSGIVPLEVAVMADLHELADHDRCPDIEFLDMHRAIDALDGWGVEVEGLDGWKAVGIFQRVTERGEELDVSPIWSKPDIYLIDIVDTLTDELITRTDIRNLRKVTVL